ncbi:MAG: lytic murein transglycosylase [Pseudomonadota bacterium]
MRCALLCLFLTLSAPAMGQSVQAQFDAWLGDTAWPEARRAGLSRQEFQRFTAGLTPDLTIPGLSLDGTVPATDSQAEFSAPARYFNERSMAALAAQGRSLAAEHATTLTRIERETGVPAHILLAIWGRESNYGRAAIPHNALQILATRAFTGTRRDAFLQEFVAALQMVQDDPNIPLRSSWAGAMGQPQFLPSSYLAYARDGDGDGRADIWGSVPDTLASIAAYLAAFGYDGRRDWGFEVRVPSALPCTRNGPDQGQSIAAWEAEGITRISGRPFPAHERAGEAFLLMPAGRVGPAFLVTPNFYVLKDYNESDLYALFVGNLGDRIAFGSPAFRADWGESDAMTRGAIARAQEQLERQGYDVGGADGLIGFKTRRAIGQFQSREGSDPTCWPSAALINEIAR